MKNIPFTPLRLFAFILIFSPSYLFSQISVVSSTGYAVNIVVIPTAIVPSTSSCTWGYNYNVRLNYTIGFSGTNIPASLYTLQGTVGCNSATHFFDLPNNGGAGTVTSTSNQWAGTSDCSTATVTSMHCSTANIEINGLGIAAQTVSFPITYVLLPVQLISFDAVKEGNRVQLKWVTANENSNNYFTIERTTNGVQWAEVKRIYSAGNSTSAVNYEWLDETPLAGTTFYRLKQTDLDGRISISEVKAVQFGAGRNNISIYPVPNAGNNITLKGLTEYSNYELSLVNNNGATVFTLVPHSFTVELPVLQPGFYIARLKNKLTGETDNFRYVKL